ncbi:MAG: hypothetical protein OET44_01195 [Gammaproteobacteria bacterium]|nr:hypothetical protein [Gammaproteobacteria bacterium]
MNDSVASEAPFDIRESRRAQGVTLTGVAAICTRESNGAARAFTATARSD